MNRFIFINSFITLKKTFKIILKFKINLKSKNFKIRSTISGIEKAKEHSNATSLLRMKFDSTTIDFFWSKSISSDNVLYI